MMPKPNSIIAGIAKIDPPVQIPIAQFLSTTAPGGGLTVHFDDGQTARLNSADPRSPEYAEIMDEFRQMLLPVYVEIDPNTKQISHLSIPLVVKIAGVSPRSNGDADVSLEI